MAMKSWVKVRHAIYACALLLLGACATTPQGRSQITTPAPLSDAYSLADMKLHLATAPSIETPCKGESCALDRAFDQQVQRLGERLAAVAYDVYPDLIKRVSHFEFVVADKAVPGSDSTSTGTVVVYRGVEQLHFDDPALSFLIAREMGHVISHHHDENTATHLAFSLAVGILFPAVHLANLFSSSAAAAQATSSVTSSAAVTSAAASSATSYVGSKIMLANLKPEQLSEADIIALGLLEQMGWNVHDVARALETSQQVGGDSVWDEDFRTSVAHLKALDEAAGAPVVSLEVGVFEPGTEPQVELPALEAELAEAELDLTDTLREPVNAPIALDSPEMQAQPVAVFVPGGYVPAHSKAAMAKQPPHVMPKSLAKPAPKVVLAAAGKTAKPLQKSQLATKPGGAKKNINKPSVMPAVKAKPAKAASVPGKDSQRIGDKTAAGKKPDKGELVKR